MAVLCPSTTPTTKPVPLKAALHAFVEAPVRQTPTERLANQATTLVSLLAVTEGDQRRAIEDLLVCHGNQCFAAILNGLQESNLAIRSRCAFVVIRMGRSVAGPALYSFLQQYPNDTYLTMAAALIADQWGGTLLPEVVGEEAILLPAEVVLNTETLVFSQASAA